MFLWTVTSLISLFSRLKTKNYLLCENIWCYLLVFPLNSGYKLRNWLLFNKFVQNNWIWEWNSRWIWLFFPRIFCIYRFTFNRFWILALRCLVVFDQIKVEDGNIDVSYKYKQTGSLLPESETQKFRAVIWQEGHRTSFSYAFIKVGHERSALVIRTH